MLTLPCGLQSWTFDASFNPSLGKLTLPRGLQSLTFGACLYRCLEKLTLPCGLQSLTVDSSFNEFGEVDSAKRPASLSFDANLNRRLELGQVDSATRPAEFDLLREFHSEFGEVDSATRPAELDLWRVSLPVSGEVDSAMWPAELDRVSCAISCKPFASRLHPQPFARRASCSNNQCFLASGLHGVRADTITNNFLQAACKQSELLELPMISCKRFAR